MPNIAKKSSSPRVVSSKPGVKKSPSVQSAKRLGKRAASGTIAGRIIYDSPLEPRHLTRSQIEAIVAKLSS